MTRGIKHLVLSLLDGLLTTTIVVLALYLLLMLFTGGGAHKVYGFRIKPRPVHLLVNVMLALVILRFPLRHRSLSRQVFFSHEGVILFAAFLITYLANGSFLASTDSAPARYLPLAILRDGNFYLDRFPFLYARGIPYFVEVVNGHCVSAYPVGAALLALPLYLPSVLGRVSPENPFFFDLEKLSAALIVALSGVVLYFTLRRLTSRPMALLITGVYAWGTSSLSTSSQALWQHGPSQLALTATLGCLVRGRSNSAWITFAGFPLAFALICRPTDLLIAVPLGIYVLVHHRRVVGGFLLSGLPPVLFQLWYNTVYFDNPFHTEWPIFGSGLWTTPFWQGLTGLLASPGRGLFIYSPVFLFSVLGMGLAWRRNGEPLLRYLSIGVLLTVALYSKWFTWWGGYCYGPRLLADLSPCMALSLYPLKDWLQKSRAGSVVFILSLAWSVGAHAMGAFWGDPVWNSNVDVDRFPEHLWSWTNNQLVNPPRRLFDGALIAIRRLPTSRTAPEHLSVSYHLNLPPFVTMTPSKPLPLAIEATNDGQAVWLAWPRGRKGSVKLGWHWRKEGQEIPGASGVAFLLYDVFPRESHDFWPALSSPSEPGVYLLELGLVRESVASFSDRSSPPLQIVVRVAN
jgi:hypothetical protein